MTDAGRGARLQFGGSPWARAALHQEPALELARWAQELGVNVGMLGKAEHGPWVVHVRRGARTLRFAGHVLADTVAFGLERWAAGADDAGIVWRAGPDKLAHGHAPRSPWTLCKLSAIGERFAHPERSRCNDCWRALDRRRAA